ncbi:hypothetical protein CO709_31585 [Burkholderia thailandensis]|uniref:hypothetical protein n=1 Tax=Burkholderia humptydooensis TaxID=430531 RepID=UPI0003A5FCCB|nr:hypothetical protein [Burkholderia humptydooensis]ATF37319.1 hypothetical protein CO709_31585 [Burkholderia thailandensis]KST74686.1 hypothetical protein WS76_11310 [Burkholderia humptydooensis]
MQILFGAHVPLVSAGCCPPRIDTVETRINADQRESVNADQHESTLRAPPSFALPPSPGHHTFRSFV